MGTADVSAMLMDFKPIPSATQGGFLYDATTNHSVLKLSLNYSISDDGHEQTLLLNIGR